MRLSRFLPVVALVLLFSATGCDSSTDLESVPVTGRWNSVGALAGVLLFVGPESGSTFTGSWSGPAGTSSSITDGSNSGGVIRFTLLGFQGGPRTFEGKFTDALRLEGAISGLSLDGPVVFRRTSY